MSEQPAHRVESGAVEIYDQIRRRMRALSMTWGQLAEKVGRHASYVRNAARGNYRLSKTKPTRSKIEEILGEHFWTVPPKDPNQ